MLHADVLLVPVVRHQYLGSRASVGVSVDDDKSEEHDNTCKGDYPVGRVKECGRYFKPSLLRYGCVVLQCCLPFYCFHCEILNQLFSASEVIWLTDIAF